MVTLSLSAGPDDVTPFIRKEREHNILELSVTGARCAGCIKKIEGNLQALPGVTGARMNLSTGKLVVEWDGVPALANAVVDRLARLGFPSKAFDPAALSQTGDEEARLLLRCLAVAGFAAGNIMLFSVSVWAGGDMGEETRTLFHWLSAMIAIPAVAYAGRPFFRSAFGALRRGRTNMDVPICLGVILAVGMSLIETVQGAEHAFFDAAVTLLFFLLIGRYLDHLLRAQARSAANDLLKMQSATASRIAEDGHVSTIRAQDIRTGDRLLLAAGERVIADGVLASQAAELDLSLLTGESAPQTLAKGANIRAGALNLGRPIIIEAAARVQDSTLAGLARLLETAEQSRSAYVRIADRAARAYVPVVHGLALLAMVWGVWIGFSTHDAVMRAVALLIITCPCALGLAVPAVQIVAAGRLFRQGLLIKSGDALERLARIDTVIFDKTGTLTLGVPQWQDDPSVPRDVLAMAAELARASQHPVARALGRAAGDGPVCSDVVEVPGMGLEGTVQGKRVRIGRAAFAGAQDQQADDNAMHLWVSIGGSPPHRLTFADHLRPDAHAALRTLKDLGVQIEVLSGDRAAVVESIALDAGAESWAGEALPEDKIARVRALKQEGRVVLMVGDGINDAAALAEADVSISMGAGADVALAASDMVLQGGRLQTIADALALARAAQTRVRENLGFSILYNICAVPLAFAGLVTPLIAAIAMSGSSLVVTLNALRLARVQEKWTPVFRQDT
ncbi:MAG TPA: cadmium-translocating P-type ATPase, partial [Alphaproteobacteria bacterium]|nr:cadmium-translocating P-type ATPase [Alphaproteobacteria bacterium]